MCRASLGPFHLHHPRAETRSSSGRESPATRGRGPETPRRLWSPERVPRASLSPAGKLPDRRAVAPRFQGPGKSRRKWPETGRFPIRGAPRCPRIQPNSLCFPCGSGNRAPETGSSRTPPTAIESALAETLHPLTATLPETPALSRGLETAARPNPNRRGRAPGRWRAAGRVHLCCQVWRFRFASDSPQ
jgi:hypothetical protein